MRKNINAVADEVMESSKQDQGTGISSEARGAGETVAIGAGKAATNVEDVVDQNKKI